MNLLLCPYDYILNPEIRENLRINLTDSIIIFDEGHNLEGKGEDVCSFELSEEDLIFTKKMFSSDYKL